MEIRIIVVFCAVIFTAARPAHTKKYRDDYEYDRYTDAFYKLHFESDLWRKPDRLPAICKVEGAELITAPTQADVAQILHMMKNYTDHPYVYIQSGGLHPDLSEEQPVINMSSESGGKDESPYKVLTKDGTFKAVWQFRNLPFVCKVQAKDIPPYDQTCGVHAKGYRYYSSVGSCYRIPNITYHWNEAFAECQAEGAHLAVINSDTERLVLKNITSLRSLDGAFPNSWDQKNFLIGVRAERTSAFAPRVFKTIFNQTLEEAGFSEWSAKEPNHSVIIEFCGSVFREDGKLNDIDCYGQYAFICEKEVVRTRTEP